MNSFEADLKFNEIEGDAVRAVFIRAPSVTRTGKDVTVLAEFEGDTVAVREGRKLATAFHPELTQDTRLHQLFLDLACEYRRESLN